MIFSLEDYFQQQAQQQQYIIDKIQLQTIKQLSYLSELLCSGKKIKKPASYYLYGPVGRGKSWLLNIFFEGIPITEKKRFHFHSFFRQLHQKIFQYSTHKDSLNQALDELLEHCKLLCFDEFHVHDIGDAMLMSQLFKALFERKIAVITTSNYSPRELLPNPLYHERFLPAIKLIEKHMTIINIAGETDYRTLPQAKKQGFTAGYYITPASIEQRQQLSLPEYNAQTISLQVGNRTLAPVYYSDNTILFNFEDICEGNTASMDYLILTETFNTWIIDNVPLLNKTSIGAQQRFINLIDILYDQNKCLYLLAHYSLQQTLANAAISDMVRTQSRLNQLQKC
ncbi:cell division protein ZapE [Entomomonas asaccharolytica]|uniref:Cell division protein ZapE n=1 Tax=Entomomonas asaccharolytica TaxID=2785331 RepID=A0A974RWJ1_9GAMM|nr:cell division protein ZapE [Entomomonas asaccharolytica]QQP85192.1 cell division protein ZapE [Entomomonas asaccharolytica]